MAASMGTYLIIIVVVIVAAIAIYLLLNSNVVTFVKPPKTTMTTAGTTTVGSNSIGGTTATTTAGGCLSSNRTTAILNGNFSTGNYLGWNATGVGFGSAPSNLIYDDASGVYYGAPWSGYNGVYFATSYQGGTNVAQGNLTSAPFKVTQAYLNFRIVSPQDNYLYIEILEGGKPFMVVHYNTFAAPNNTNGYSTFENASILISPLLCQNAQVRVVADVVGQKTSVYKYIAVTGFYMSSTRNQTSGILVNSTVV